VRATGYGEDRPRQEVGRERRPGTDKMNGVGGSSSRQATRRPPTSARGGTGLQPLQKPGSGLNLGKRLYAPAPRETRRRRGRKGLSPRRPRRCRGRRSRRAWGPRGRRR
jgi:hypothetical protein